MGSKDKKKKRAERLRQLKHKKHFEKPKPVEPVDIISLSPGAAILSEEGILIKARIEVPRILADQLKAQKRPIPAPVHGFILVDTGATKTCIADSAVADLQLNPCGMKTVVGVAGPTQLPEYRVCLHLPEFQVMGNFQMCVVKNMKHINNDPKRRMLGLLGRDFLKHAKMTYDGENGTVEIKLHRHTLGGPKPVTPIVNNSITAKIPLVAPNPAARSSSESAPSIADTSLCPGSQAASPEK